MENETPGKSDRRGEAVSVDREHWANCITHFDAGAEEFLGSYFNDEDKKCLLVAGAGFDPRSCFVAEILSGAMGEECQLQALLIREERPAPPTALVRAAERNEEQLKSLISVVQVEHIEVFAEDSAAVGDERIASKLRELHAEGSLFEGVTDVILDMSALSIGISFPSAKMLLKFCEDSKINFHVITVQDPDLDDLIKSEV